MEGKQTYLKSPLEKSYSSRSWPQAAILAVVLGYPDARFSP
jgi:hypothetical protein